MRLRYDCVRDVLLCAEKKLQVTYEDGSIQFEDLGFQDLCDSKLKKDYSESEIYYALSNLKQAGYIEMFDGLEADNAIQTDTTLIHCITYDGHKFLDNVRDPKIWKISKGILSKFASVSLEFVENVTAQVITNLINQYINNP